MSNRLGVERQTLWLAMAPVLILAALLESYFIYVSFGELDRNLFERGKILTQQLASGSEYGVFSNNRGMLQQSLDVASMQPDVSSITVRNQNNGILAATGQQVMKVNATTPFFEDSHTVWLWQAIYPTQIQLDEGAAEVSEVSRAPLGSVTLELSKQSINAKKMELLVANLLLTLLVLLFALLAVMRASRKITHPIVEMERVVRHLAEGDLHERLSAEQEVLELATLASGINQMAARLQLDRNMLELEIEQKTNEFRLKKEEADEANLNKTRFLAAASHDLRQPIHALGLFVAELQSNLSTDTQKLIADKIEGSVVAMSELLNSLLDVSKLDAGVVAPRMQIVELADILARLSNEYAVLADEKNIKLRVVPSTLCVYSDITLLERILGNLLSNAIRYTPVGGAIFVACRKRRDHVRIEVRDSGIGIAPSEHQNIFREFVQLSNQQRDRSQGLGLGLAIVRRLAKLMGIVLTLKSEVDAGSTFYLSLPAAEKIASAPRPFIERRISLPVPVSELSAPHILVVEDDELARTGMQGLLQSWGFKVTSVTTVAAAKACLQNELFAAVISDYRLPGEDGLSLANFVQSHAKNKRLFVLMTGDTSAEITQFVAARGLHLLYKPVRPAKLRSLLSHLLSS